MKKSEFLHCYTILLPGLRTKFWPINTTAGQDISSWEREKKMEADWEYLIKLHSNKVIILVIS